MENNGRVAAGQRPVDPPQHCGFADGARPKNPDGKVGFTLALTIPEYPLRDQIAQDTRLTVQALPGGHEGRRAPGRASFYHYHAGGFGDQVHLASAVNQIVTWIIAPILVLVGIRFILLGIA